MRYRLLAAAALVAAVCLGVGIGWLVWGNNSENGTTETANRSPTATPVATNDATAPPLTSTPEPGALISISFDPQQIWNLLEGAETRGRLDAIYACASRVTDWNACIWQAMQQNGGSRDAFDFFKLTGGFLENLKDDGQVKLGTIVYPFRANENVQPILLGGDPPVIQVENPDLHGAVEHDPGFTILQAQHPNILFWGSGPALETASGAPDGGQSFIFRYRLLDGCHACAVLGYARIEYDFFPDGRQQTLKLLNIVESQN
jgi:hypothetical protein